MLSNCGYSFSDLVFKRSFFEVIHRDEGCKTSLEIDGLFVYNDLFVLVEEEGTIDTNDMKRILKKAKSLATNAVNLFTKDKHGVVIMAYYFIVEDSKKDIVITTKEIHDFVRENKAMLLMKDGREFRFLNDNGATDPQIQSCNQPENCDDWCDLVQAKKQSFPDAGHGSV